MKVYRTTRYRGDMKCWTRYSSNKQQFASTKGNYLTKYSSGDYRITLEMADVPDEAWELVEDATR